MRVFLGKIRDELAGRYGEARASIFLESIQAHFLDLALGRLKFSSLASFLFF